MEEKLSFKGIKMALEDFQLVENHANIYLDLNTFTVFTSEHALECSSSLLEVFVAGTFVAPTSQKELRDLTVAKVAANKQLFTNFKEKQEFINEYVEENPVEFKNLLKAVKGYNANSEGRIVLNKESLEVSFVTMEEIIESSTVEITKKDILTTFSHNEKITSAALKLLCAEKYLDL